MVRPRMAPLKRALSFLRMTKGSSQLLVGPAVSLEREQMKVRSSTRATSLGAERARKQPGQSFSLSLVKVPAWTSWSQRKSYSACEPSIPGMLSGWVGSAIFSTQRMRCLFVVGGGAIAASTIAVFIGRRKSFAYKSSLPQRDCQPPSWSLELKASFLGVDESLSGSADWAELTGHAILLDWRGDLMIRGLTRLFALKLKRKCRVVARFRG